MNRTFIVTSNAPRAQSGPSAVVMARTPHKAAEIFARRFAGTDCRPLTDLPTREDDDGILWRNWRATVAHPGGVPEGAPAVLFIREQLGWALHRDAPADLIVIDEFGPL